MEKGKVESAAGRRERRLVTALCYDLVGSTDLLSHSDVEDVDELILAFQQNAGKAIASRGGSLREVGDGGVALFPIEMDPRDAASAAINAGLEIVDACARVGREKGRADMHVRVGIATSMGLLRGDRGKASPDNVTAIALAMATRLESMAGPDTVLISSQTRALAHRSHVFSFQGERQLKGIAEPERVWRALHHKLDVGRFQAFGRLGIPTIGREAELRMATDCWRDAVAGSGSVLLIEGEAGMGKSRLLHDIRRATREKRNRILLFQCWPSGTHSALHPLVQSLPNIGVDDASRLTASALSELFARFDVRDDEVVGIFSFLLGVENPIARALKDAGPEVIEERVRHAVHRGLDLLCAGGPVVFAVEDVHWADAATRKLLVEFARLIDRYPALLVLTTRPETPGELATMPNTKRVRLARLSQDETRRAIAAMWPRARSSDFSGLADAVDRITAGVPLFIEEICQWMAENDDFTTDQLTRAVSPAGSSILERVLSARLEPLGSAKSVASAAAVVGMRFNRALLSEVVPELSREQLADALERLTDAGLLARTKSGEEGLYLFRHALIQETIYNATLRKARQSLHEKLYRALDRNRDIATWMGIDALANHAERAGLIKEAIGHFVAAGKESSARSAMGDARGLLEHARRLCGEIKQSDERDALELSTLSALGPVLTSTEGPGSQLARSLYEDGVRIARRRPTSERAALFPIYWGWWFTSPDVDNKRAQAILEELKDVDDAEVQLQIRHCIWTIDFYLGRHESCVAAVDAGIPLYAADRSRENATLFGGHDAKVCGLLHKGLSLWLTGQASSARRLVAEACSWAEQTGHVGSIAHAYINEAMLNCFRRDFDALQASIPQIRQLTKEHRLRSLSATTEIFEGWCIGNGGDLERGKEMIRRGLAIQAELQTPEDYPVYCGMLAELLARTGDAATGLRLLESAEEEAAASGHRYWLAELHHRRGRLLYELGASEREINAALVKSLAISLEQNAVALMLGAYDTLLRLGLFPETVARYRGHIERAKSRLEPGEALVVHPEEPLRRRSAAYSSC